MKPGPPCHLAMDLTERHAIVQPMQLSDTCNTIVFWQLELLLRHVTRQRTHILWGVVNGTFRAQAYQTAGNCFYSNKLL